MYEVLGCIIAGLTTLSAVLAVVELWFRYQVINLDGLHDQIGKLVRANNVDRAVRLCGFGKSPVLQATKNLLVRVHRPYSLNLVYHEELAALRALEDRWDVRAMTRSIVEFGSSLVLLMILYTGARESTLIHWCIGIMVVMTAVAMWANGRIRFYLRSAQVYLLRLRNTLYACAEYIPPEDRPSRKMTAEEIAAWRASMDTLEHGVAEQKRRGEDVKAADVHDARVQPDGVLPPL